MGTITQSGSGYGMDFEPDSISFSHLLDLSTEVCDIIPISDQIAEREEWKLDTLLVVVDMQNDFVTGEKGTVEARRILPAVNEKIRQAQRVIYTLDTHNQKFHSAQEGKNAPKEHCKRGSWGHSLAEGLLFREGSEIIEKHTYGSLKLGQTVRELADMGEIEAVELIGVCTDACVITNALLIKTFCPKLPVYLDAACCAGETPQGHKAALEVLKVCQVKIK